MPCTLEATPWWRSVMKRVFGLRERVVDLGRGELVLWRHPLYRRAISTPYRDRLGLAWEGPPPGVDDLVEAVRAEEPVVLKDVGELETPTRVAGLRQQHTNADVVLDEDLEKRLGRAARKSVRKAREDYGLEVDVDPRACFESFWEIYLDTRRRLGVPPYSRRFFALLFDALGGPVVLFRCRLDRRALGYLICYRHEDDLVSAHLGYEYRERHLKVADYLFVTAFLWGRDDGRQRYRFGGDYNNQISLIEAKRKLGAVPRPQYDYVTKPYRIQEDRPEALVRRMLRATPPRLFRRASLLTRIYFA